MAAEDLAVILELSGLDPVQFTCADATTISKGTLLKISSDVGVLATDADGNVFAGIAAEDKKAGDGSTQIAVYTPGQGNYFDIKNNGAHTITAGTMCSISGINIIRAAVDTDFEGGKVVGKVMEDAAASETVRVKV